MITELYNRRRRQEVLTFPNGSVRGGFVEFGVDRVLVAGPDGHVEHTLAELIPYGFKFSE